MVKLPAATPMDLGVLYGCAVPTGAGIALNELKITAESTVAVIGLGGVGLLALMASKSFSPRKLIAIDVNINKLMAARDLGADIMIKADDSDVLGRVLEETNGKGVDFVIEAAGMVATIEQGFSLVKNGGLLVFASHPRAGESISLDPFDLISGKLIKGSWGGASNPDIDVPIFDRMFQAGDLNLSVMVEHTYRLDQINEALDDLECKRVGRPLIKLGTGHSGEA